MKKSVLVLLVILLSSTASSAPLPEQEVPAPLKPWIKWVLHGEEKKECPRIYNKVSKQVCSWPSTLEIRFDRETAVFSQEWTVYAGDVWLPLPGNRGFWPGKVKVNGKEWLVGEKRGAPAVFIETPGTHTIKGTFVFDQRPEWIQIPERSGLLELTLLGKTVDFPRLDRNGRLWLKSAGKESDEKKRGNSHETVVHRLVRDSIPMELVTRLDLSISGKHRTLTIGRIGLDHFIPVEITSPLPVKVEQNGAILIQARPGKWKINITLRHKGPAKALSKQETGGFDSEKEIWSFEPHNHLRIVDIKGPSQIDPQQTTMPEKWKSFPAYLMDDHTRMEFVVKKRGNPHPAPDRLDLKRTLWLDFDGNGFSVKDTITGLMTTGWRLSITPPVEPGRILLNGKEQFITKLDDSGRAGIEMRYGRVNMIAEGRIDRSGAIPVAGWDRSFHSAKGEIHLPPGWSLFDASGIDNIRQTWLKSWRLFDLFLVLIITLGVARLVSFRWGAVSLLVLVLIQHEPGAPLWVFLNILAALALLKVVPGGRIYALINNYRLVSLFALVLICLPFMVGQVKHGIYPQLEYQWRAMDSTLQRDTAKSAPDVSRFKKSAVPNLAKQTAEQAARQTLRAGSSYSDRFKAEKRTMQVDEFDAGAQIQTGAGMPTWRWNSIGFSWNGPVQQGETMKFIFVSPRLNMVLGFVRVILLGLLAAGLCGIRVSRSKGVDLSRLKPGGFGPGAMGLLALFSVVLAPALPAGAETSFPPEKLLNELKAKLIQEEQPQCAPHCAVNARMTLAMDETSLSIVMEVHSLHDSVAVPLPGTAMHWLPSLVLVNGNKTSGLYRDPMTGHLWIPLPKGIHRINLKGKLPQRNSVELPFLLKPNHVAVRARGWKVEGLHANGLVDEQLKLTRTKRETEEQEGFETDLLPSFVEITRVLHLGLTWQTETVVRRKTPTGAAVAIGVPLLQGESVTSDVEVKNGRVLVHLGPEQTSARWVSTLEKKPRLVLEASNTLEFSEVWKLDIGTMWHAEIQGIPPIHHQNEKKQWFPQFRPWPGEKLQIAISRPQGVSGQTYTIEKSVTELTPGNRMINGRLRLSLRSSRGSRHTITLPEHSKLQKLVKNNRPQPFNQEGNRVTLSIVPGHQEITLFWQTPEGMGFRFKAPEIDAGIASVDAHTSIKMPQNRWILFCKGPYVGPAVLFWSTLLVLLLISFALGRLTITPLKGYHWFLLGLGLTQASVLTLVPVACWLIALGLRKKSGAGLSDSAFNALQILLPVLTMAAVVVLFHGIHNGLLGHPDMQIAGNGSSSYSLKWYQDITDSTLPQPVVFSLPMTVYRVLILAWALWIAFALMKWLRWGWECYSSDGLWRKIDMKRFIRSGKKGTGEEESNRPLDRQEPAQTGRPD